MRREGRGRTKGPTAERRDNANKGQLYKFFTEANLHDQIFDTCVCMAFLNFISNQSTIQEIPSKSRLENTISY